MRPSTCGDGQKFKHISPHLASPEGEGQIHLTGRLTDDTRLSNRLTTHSCLTD